MLMVYMTKIPKPPNSFDLSGTPLNELCDAVLSIVEHQKSGHIWFGYLDGWMITPKEEVILRKAIRKFDCSVVSLFPLAFSHAWKNECLFVKTGEEDGISKINHDGSTLQHGCSLEHGHISPQPSVDQQHHQDRETRRPQKRRIQKGQDTTQNKTNCP